MGIFHYAWQINRPELKIVHTETPFLGNSAHKLKICGQHTMCWTLILVLCVTKLSLGNKSSRLEDRLRLTKS